MLHDWITLYEFYFKAYFQIAKHKRKMIFLNTQCTLLASHREIKLENSLLDTFNSARSCYTGHWRKKVISIITQQWIMNITVLTEMPDKIHPLIQEWNEGYGYIQPLSDWIWILLSGRNFIPGTINLA